MEERASFPRFEKLEPSLKERIFDAAVKEFGRFGFRAASMNRLVEGAGISKGALFKYFGTKARLFDYVYRASLDEVKNQLRTVRDISGKEPFFTRLERVIRAGLKFTADRPLSAAIYYRVIYTGDAPHGNSILSEIQGASRRYLKTLLDDGIRNGELKPDIDPEKAAFIIQSVLDRFLQAHYLDFMAPVINGSSAKQEKDPSQVTERWIREITGLFKNGLEKQTGREKS